MAKQLTEALIVHDLALTKELDDIVHIGIVGKAENVVIGSLRLHFSRHVFVEVGDGIPLDLHHCRSVRHTGCRLRIYPRGVVNEVISEPLALDLVGREVTGKLMHDGAYHLKMSKLFRTY